jgi:arginyl-tRNA synthetase
VITRDLRRALGRALAAEGFPAGADPGLRPTGRPGQYAASAALTLAANPPETAQRLAATLAQQPWIETAEVTGPGYLTVTVTADALAAVAHSIIVAGPGCVTSDALADETVPAPPPGDPLAAPTWEEARAALAARLTARLAAAAGATVAVSADTERNRLTRQASTDSETGVSTARSEDPASGPDARPQSRQDAGSGGSSPRAAASFAGRDAVLFTLARAIPGKPLRVEPEIIARHALGNPAYAVRYAHARAASGMRWAVFSSASNTIGVGEAPELSVPAGGADTMAVFAIGPARRDSGGYGGSPPRETTAVPRPPANPGELVLLDALSWLPERVATAARRGRPDEFARYLEDLASVTVDVLSSPSHPGNGAAPGSGRLTLARAARTGLGAALGLLEVSAPERLLAEIPRSQL